MNQINFDYKAGALIDKNDLDELIKKIIPEIAKINSEIKKEYNSQYAFAHVPSDENNLKIIQDLVQKKHALNPAILIVIGIGGSNLGALAIHEFINGKLYNDKNPRLKVYFADTVDTDYISDIFNIVENELFALSNVIINVISKSGSTTESIANLELFIELLKKHKGQDFNKFLVVTTDKESVLWDYAKKINCDVLEIPKNVGGRYSVFTSVGLFPLGLLDINIKELLKGANKAINKYLDINVSENYSAISAAILYHYYQKNIKINDTFLFGVDFESIGKWFRQLMGESIGKEFNLKNEKINIGITPNVSIGSVDLHSVAQLYLGGPNDKFTTFVQVEKNLTNLHVPNLKEFEAISPHIQGLSFSKIMYAIILGTQEAYTKKKLPYTMINLKERSEIVIGEFLQFKMFEIVYLAYLFDINPFDQPNVELYKAETKKILSQEIK